MSCTILVLRFEKLHVRHILDVCEPTLQDVSCIGSYSMLQHSIPIHMDLFHGAMVFCCSGADLWDAQKFVRTRDLRSLRVCLKQKCLSVMRLDASIQILKHATLVRCGPLQKKVTGAQFFFQRVLLRCLNCFLSN